MKIKAIEAQHSVQQVVVGEMCFRLYHGATNVTLAISGVKNRDEAIRLLELNREDSFKGWIQISPWTCRCRACHIIIESTIYRKTGIVSAQCSACKRRGTMEKL